MAGYGPTGFERKRLPEILADKNQAQKAALGQDLNLDPETPDGQISGLMALSDDQLWQIAEFAVDATNPDNATEATLSNLVKLNFIQRLDASATLLVFTMTGTPGLSIAAGQRIGEESGSLVAVTTASFTFAATGVAQVAGRLEETGPIDVETDSLIDIKTPQAGWFTATNASPSVRGRNRETDSELRLRRARSVGTNSQNMIDSMRGKLANLDGVSHTNVIQNQGDSLDANGLAGHSFEAIVAGGDTNSIAQVIWDTFPLGIGIQGLTSGVAIDAQLRLQTVPFTRPAQVPSYVKVTLKKRPGYPANGATTIKQNIKAYAEGSLVADRGFFAGDSVIYTELYTPVNTVPYQELVSVEIGRSPATVSEANLTITIREYSYFDVDNISVVEL